MAVFNGYTLKQFKCNCKWKRNESQMSFYNKKLFGAGKESPLGLFTVLHFSVVHIILFMNLLIASSINAPNLFTRPNFSSFLSLLLGDKRCVLLQFLFIYSFDICDIPQTISPWVLVNFDFDLFKYLWYPKKKERNWKTFFMWMCVWKIYHYYYPSCS